MAIQFDNTNTGSATLKPATSGTLALTLPSADGTTGQALTTNGSGQLAFSTVGGGGLTGFTAAESTAAPNATVYVDSLTASAASTDADVAFVAKGAGATLAQVPTSTAAGGNKRGQYATDWTKFRNTATEVASGSGSTISGGYINTASGSTSTIGGGVLHNASGTSSTIGGGYQQTASGNYSVVAGGYGNTASGDYSSNAGGGTNVASGSYSYVGGGQANNANGISSVVHGGAYGLARSIVGNVVFSASNSPIATATGINQSGLLVLAVQTTTAVTTFLRSNTSAAGTTNQVILPNNSAYYFKGSIVCGVTGGGDSSAWTFEGLIKRGANAASTVIVQSVVNLVGQNTGASTWTVSLSADTTNGGLAVAVFGQASTTIRWVCKIETTEMTY
jgi:hypothetical protein